MHKQLADLEKYNIANPCKEDRKKVMKKSFSDSDYDNSDQENKVTKNKKRMDTKDNLRCMSSKIKQQDILSQLKTTDVNLKDDSFSLLDESDETSFTDDSCESKSKKNIYLLNLQEKIKSLRKQNKQLQNEVKALKDKTSITLENKMENLDKMVDKLAIKIQNANKCVAELNKNIPAKVFQKQQLYPSVTHIKNEDTFQNEQIQYDDFIPVINAVMEHDEANDIEEELVMDVLTDFKKVKGVKQCDKMHNKFERDVKKNTSEPKINDRLTNFKEVKELKQCDKMHDKLERDMKKDTAESKIIEKINDNKIVSIGRGVTISQSMMQNIRTSDIGKMTCDLMSCIFTNKEMASSSRTGKKNNKVKSEENSNKKPLDCNKLLAIKDYVLSQFKNTPNGEKLFNTTVSNKCKNVARNYK
ncbi:cylicin-1 isoform X2 [Monomorium pharaonis]|nr:cylicin-1 isoform X2 [Monomorium pharaonis]XP_036151194.1 cylicin-1 isoform X2 [Monomorium pharaonis]XP_036151195.1 cylicin-1 isoform X2 [Monomorium pharaonis]